MINTPDVPLVATSDIAVQLANVNYRLDLILTVLIFSLCFGFVVGFIYIIYRFILRFM